MLSALGWLISIIGVVGAAGCIAVQAYFVWRANAAPETKVASQNKFVLGLAGCVGFFLVAFLGAILLQTSGAYDLAR